MTTEQIITQDPDIHGGMPVFTGTRVPVKSLIDHLKAGDGLDYFLEGFPSVSRQQAILTHLSPWIKALNINRTSANTRSGSSSSPRKAIVFRTFNRRCAALTKS